MAELRRELWENWARSPAAYRYAHHPEELLEEACEALDRAACRMKKYADRHRREVEYQVGDFVFLRLLPTHKSLQRIPRHSGLVPRYDGPFRIVERVRRLAYRLHLPPRLPVHPVFHVSLLKPYYADDEDPAQHQPHRPPPTVQAHFSDQAEDILAPMMGHEKNPIEKGRSTHLGSSPASWRRI